MADTKKRGGELSRSATVTVRLDPKLRYLAGLAARKQRRTLSSFIEWSIEESLNRISLQDYSGQDRDVPSISNQGEELWDVDEPERFVKLAIYYPELLTHHEQKLWKLIRENGSLWDGEEDDNGRWQWQISENSLLPERLRYHWDEFNKAATGELHRFYLPRWPGMPEVSAHDLEFDEDQ